MIKTFIFRLIILTLAVVAVTYLFPGISVDGYLELFLASLALGIINAIVRPVILFFTYQLRFLTFGVFTLCLNAVFIVFVGSLVEGFHVDGFLNALGGAFIISLMSAAANEFVREKKD
ncbi:MAG: phage holin family protein [Deltaproteobacteria bacterium]|nr:phage holin family protein [Deltaproteobacteria bacterium]